MVTVMMKQAEVLAPFGDQKHQFPRDLPVTSLVLRRQPEVVGVSIAVMWTASAVLHCPLNGPTAIQGVHRRPMPVTEFQMSAVRKVRVTGIGLMRHALSRRSKMWSMELSDITGQFRTSSVLLFLTETITIHRVRWRHSIYGHNTIGSLWV